MANNSSPLPPPLSFGAPPRYSSWRHGQDAAFSQILQFLGSSSKRVIVCCLPTGVGKSLVYMLASRISGRKTAVLTATRGLQDQLLDPTKGFPELLVDVRGMSNYPCKLTAERAWAVPYHLRNCDSGACLDGVYCRYKQTGCDYFGRVSQAAKSPIMSTNYAMWLRQSDKGDEGFCGSRNLLVLDEAHEAAEELSRHLRVELQLSELDGACPVQDPTSLDQWRDYSRRLHLRVASDVELASGQNKRTLQDLASRLERVSKAGADWIVQDTESGWEFEPLWPGPYRERLFCGIGQVVMVSATVRPKTLELLGLTPADYDFHEWPSPFDPRRRPIIHIPTVAMKAKTSRSDLELWGSRHDQIIRPRLDRKGMAHTVSFERARLLRELSEFRGLMLLNTPKTTRDIVREFKDSPPPRFMVSPSISTGYDFPYTDCEYQIISKIAFPDSRSPLMAARQKADPEYPMFLAACDLVQAVGRGMRAPNDACETFILDDQVKWFIWKFKHFFPRWFLESYRSEPTIPPPPPRLLLTQ